MARLPINYTPGSGQDDSLEGLETRVTDLETAKDSLESGQSALEAADVALGAKDDALDAADAALDARVTQNEADIATIYTEAVIDGSIDYDQLSQEVKDLIGIVDPPPPLDDQINFTVNIQDDTLVATVTANAAFPVERVLVAYGADPAPTDPLAGVERVFTGDDSLNVTLPTWNLQYEYWYYAYNSTLGWVKATPAIDSGEGAHPIAAHETEKPIATFSMVPNGTNDGFDWTISMSDLKSGIDYPAAVVRRRNADGTTSELFRPGSNATGTYPGVPGDSVTAFLLAYDLHGNVRQTPDVTATIPVNTTDGQIDFDVAQPVAGGPAITITEEDGVLTVSATLSGNTSGGTHTAKVGVHKHTATNQVEDQADFSPPNGVLTFTPPGNGNPVSASVDIDLFDIDENEHNMFEVFLYDSSGPIIGANKAYLILVEGTATLSAGTGYTPNGNDLFLVEMKSSDTWPITPSNDPAWPAGANFEVVLDANMPAGLQPIPGAIGQAYYVPYAVNYVSDYSWDSKATRVEATITVPADNTYYFWGLFGNAVANKSYYLLVDGDRANTGVLKGKFYCDSHAADEWDFVPLRYLTNFPDEPYGVFLTAGDHTVAFVPREGTGNCYAAALLGTTDPAYNPSDNYLPNAGTPGMAAALAEDPSTIPVAGGSWEPNASNPQFPIGYVPTTEAQVALSPGDNALNQSTNAILEMEVTEAGAAGIFVNSPSLVVRQNGAVVPGAWSAVSETRIRFSVSTWPNAASVSVSGSNYGYVYVNGVQKALPALVSGDWNFTVASGGGTYNPFANVPVYPGRLTDGTYDAIKAQYSTTEVDDPINILNINYDRRVDCQTRGDFQNALATAQEGDLITVPNAPLDWVGEGIAAQGSALKRIYICPIGFVTGLFVGGQAATFTGGTVGFTFKKGAEYVAIYGIRFLGQGTNGIRYDDGGDDGQGNPQNGPLHCRVSGCGFEEIGKVRGAAEDTIHIGVRSHNFRIDHNWCYHNYNDIRMREDPYKDFPSLGGRVDHNYIGPPGENFLEGPTAPNYGFRGFAMGITTTHESNPDTGAVYQYNVIDFGGAGGTHIDPELIEGKLSGIDFTDNILFGRSSGNSMLSLRFGFRWNVTRNYLVGCGIGQFGAGHHIWDNLIDGKGLLRIGIRFTQWGVRPYAGSTAPRTGDNDIHNNSIYDTIDYCWDIGDQDDGGGSEPVTNIALSKNYGESISGVVGRWTNVDNGFGLNTGCTFNSDYYYPKNLSTNGSAFAEETTPTEYPTAVPPDVGCTSLVRV